MVTIIDEKYVQVESGSTHYVEFLCTSDDLSNLPAEGVATNSLAYTLDDKSMYYFDGTEWQTVGGSSQSDGGDVDDGGGVDDGGNGGGGGYIGDLPTA